jgi:predicted nucleic acid-binding protein
MKRLKIYLDTSVISHLDAPDAPENMAATLELWVCIQDGLYEAVISNVTLEEINRCAEPKLSALYEKLSAVDYERIEETPESRSIAQAVIAEGILREKSYDDARHIGCAIAAECDVIVSWNFKHMVNIKTIRGVRFVTLKEGYQPIEIYAPPTLLKEE